MVKPIVSILFVVLALGCTSPGTYRYYYTGNDGASQVDDGDGGYVDPYTSPYPSQPTQIMPFGRGYLYQGPGGSGTVMPFGRGYSIQPHTGGPPTTCMPLGRGMTCQ